MRTKNTYRILMGIIIILLAYNMSMTVSYVTHRQQDKRTSEQTETLNTDVPSEQRTRFFREQLNLRPNQIDTFRELNRDFNRKGHTINSEMQSLRIEMVEELGKENPDNKQLSSISEKIGNLHTELKQATIDYYLKMKGACDIEQQEKLNKIFMSILEKDEGVSLPQQGRGPYGRFK